MARARKTKPTLESLVFSTPEQKLLKLMLDSPTTSFTPRVLASLLKGVRGLGGTEGLLRILNQLATLGIVQFNDNNKTVSLVDEHTAIRVLKTFAAICDLEGVQELVSPISSKGILYGSRSSGRNRTDSDYDVFIVSDQPSQVQSIIGCHPIGKRVELVTYTPDDYHYIEHKEPELARKLDQGIVMWGSNW